MVLFYKLKLLQDYSRIYWRGYPKAKEEGSGLVSAMLPSVIRLKTSNNVCKRLLALVIGSCEITANTHLKHASQMNRFPTEVLLSCHASVPPIDTSILNNRNTLFPFSWSIKLGSHLTRLCLLYTTSRLSANFSSSSETTQEPPMPPHRSGGHSYLSHCRPHSATVVVTSVTAWPPRKGYPCFLPWIQKPESTF